MFRPPINSVQIQKQFLFLEFYFKFSLAFKFDSKRKVVPYLSFYQIAKFGKF
jgi:hypothetical protein